MIDILKYLIGFLFGGGVVAAVLLYLLLHPEKIEKWSALIYKGLSSLGTLFNGAHKQYVRHELQGRINEFTKDLKDDAPFLAGARLSVEWVGEGISRKSFLQGDRVVLRLRREDPEDMNFVHGAYMFVSASLLAKTKRYISPSQGQAIDLFVSTKLFEKEKPSARGVFLDEFLHAKIGDPDGKVAKYYDCMAKLDNGGYFYPVLLQELEFLGDKVFGERQDSKIIGEVDDLMEFLEPIALRNVGDVGERNFERDYCRFGIVIVGKRAKVAEAGAAPYLTYIRARLIPSGIESLYLFGPAENKDVIDHICFSLQQYFERVRDKTATVKLRVDGREIDHEQYLVVLRKLGVRLFQASA